MRNNRRDIILRKELAAVEKQEKKLKMSAMKAKPSTLKNSIEEKIPAKVYSGLESAFCKAFSVVFSQGRGLIEKSYNKENIAADHAIRDYAIQVKGGRREFRKMNRSAVKTGAVNLSLTTLEGLALGALGIGVPDVLLFASTLLKGIYETGLNYGFDYTSEHEQLRILKMMQAALSFGDAWEKLDNELDALFLPQETELRSDILESQLKATASAFAVDMLLLKFIQGIPVLGVIGGAANPVYYNKIMKYVTLKYRKHYLLKLLNT